MRLSADDATRPEEAVAQRGGVRWGRHWACVHYASLVAGFFALLWVDRHQWFYADEWEFIHRFVAPSGAGLFVPHSEHWVTVPLLIWRGLFAVVGVRSYVPYVAVLLLTHVAIVHMVWRLMRRNGVTTWIATCISLVVLSGGVGFENIIQAFQIAFTIPVLTALIAARVLEGTDRERLRVGAAWALLVIGLMSSAIGVAMTAAVFVTALLRWGWRRAAVVVSVPAIVFLVWAITEHALGTTTPGPRSDYLSLGDYIWTGLSSLASFTGIPVGAVLVIALGWWIVTRWDLAREHTTIFAMAISAPLLYLFIGQGRVSFGPDEASSSRYLYVAVILVIPAGALAVSVLQRRTWAWRGAAAALLVGALLHNGALLYSQAGTFAKIKQASREQILAAVPMVGNGKTLGTLPDPVVAPNLSGSDLTTLAQRGDLPGDDAPTDVAKLSAETALNVELGPTAAIRSTGHVTAVQHDNEKDGKPSQLDHCTDFPPLPTSDPLYVTFDRAGAISVKPTVAAVTVSVTVVDVNQLSLVVQPQTMSLGPGETRWVSVSTAQTVVAIAAPASAVEICD